MTPKRFEHLLRIYGADLARWPEEDRAGAVRLSQGDPLLTSHLADEAGVDHALRLVVSKVDEARCGRVSAAVLARIDASKAGTFVPSAPYWVKPGALVPAFLLLVGVTLAGFVAGDPGTGAGLDGGVSALVSSDVVLVSWER